MSEIYFMLKKFNLFDYLDEEFMSLSSGQAQKLSIIRGLMKNPILTLFDESFSSLDSSSKDMFKEIYNNHLEKDQFKATIWVTHNKYELDFKNKKILRIFDGKIHSEDNF
jgi:ABC-type iron transport system FetAB ATPase subunit